MYFIDEAKIYLKAGDGGNGIASFRREKYVELGGPNGGNGGDGGSIILKVAPNINTLIDFRYKQHFKAPKGQNGQGSDKTGKSGEDLVIYVPQGTQVLSKDKKYILYDFDNPEQQEIILKGGGGGLGNSNFKSSRNQAPRKFTVGKIGNEMWIWLNLKLLSNIGLLGMPNAGKSTFLSRVTSAKPKIADYPFTTLKPQLGVVYYEHNEFTIADIPGLIEDASLGHGLGIKFLKHLERCEILLHIIDITSDDIINNYEIIRKELKNYGKLIDKMELILLSKIDMLDDKQILKKQKELEDHTNKNVMLYSGINNTGIVDMKRNLFNILQSFKSETN
jgi:GTP-binding protein